MAENKQRERDKKTTPRDAQKGGQGGVSQDQPENTVAEDEPEKHKV